MISSCFLQDQWTNHWGSGWWFHPPAFLGVNSWTFGIRSQDLCRSHLGIIWFLKVCLQRVFRNLMEIIGISNAFFVIRLSGLIGKLATERDDLVPQLDPLHLLLGSDAGYMEPRLEGFRPCENCHLQKAAKRMRIVMVRKPGDSARFSFFCGTLEHSNISPFKHHCG